MMCRIPAKAVIRENFHKEGDHGLYFHIMNSRSRVSRRMRAASRAAPHVPPAVFQEDSAGGGSGGTVARHPNVECLRVSDVNTPHGDVELHQETARLAGADRRRRAAATVRWIIIAAVVASGA